MNKRISLIVFLLAFGFRGLGGSLPLEKQSQFFTALPAPAAPSPWAFVAGTAASSTTGNSVTTSGINTTGATLEVVVQGYFGSTLPTVTSSTGSTFTLITNLDSGDGGPRKISVWYCNSPVTGSSETFSSTQTSSFATLAVLTFSGGAGGFLDQMNSHIAIATTVQPGSITPSQDNCLVVSGLEFKSGTTATIDSGFSTPQKAGSTGTAVGAAAAYITQTTASAVNPTWTQTSANGAATIVSFK